MKSFQIIWKIYTTTVGPMSGSSYVHATSAKAGKVVVEQFLRHNLSNLESVDIGRAYRHDAPCSDAYITATSRFE